MLFRRRASGPGEMPPDCGDARTAGNAMDLSSTDSEDTEVAAAAAAAFVPSLRHGAAAERGGRLSMEDCHVGADSFALPAAAGSAEVAPPSTRAFYAVFDGHGGVTAAEFASRHLLDFTLAEAAFPARLPEALRSSFLRLDAEFHAAVQAGRTTHSGSTALAALVWGNQLLVANAGDSRAVLCRGGKAMQLSTDHKPASPAERARIYCAGGSVCGEGRLNAELDVSRAIGDFHLETLKTPGTRSPLTAEPEVVVHALNPEDEFLLLGCDGLWDMMTIQHAVDVARAQLRAHNDPTACAAELVKRALAAGSTDNVSAITICFRETPPPPRRTPSEGGRLSSSMGARTLSREGLSVLNSAMLAGSGLGLPQIPEQRAAQLGSCAAVV